MSGFEDSAFYGEQWAERYDELHPLSPDAEVDFLTGLAGSGRALELAIGTGRVALPLARRGIPVEGLDSSPSMVERLRAKPGGAEIPVTIADMATFQMDRPFSLVFLVFNSIFMLPTQEQQVSCFRSVAEVLEPDGVFVLQCFVPDPARYDRGQRVQVLEVTEDSARIEVAVHDAARQQVTLQKLSFGAAQAPLQPVHIRYIWPSELDLMAQLAGLRLRERYADWQRRPFDSGSTTHVAVYERDTAG